jgi:hypothetical protein
MRACLCAGDSRLRERTSRVERMALRGQRTATLMLAAYTLVCVGSAALANPGPMGIVYTHIHAGGGDFCSALPVSTCEEFVQVTDATGILNFDMILPCWWDDFEWLYGAVTNLEFTIQWPAEWQFVDASACGSGAVSVVHEGNGARFSIENLEGAPVNGQLLGLGRVVLNVTSEGSTSCPDWPHPESISWVEGRISGCGNCVHGVCGDYSPVRPALPSPVLDLTADSSGTASGVFRVESDGSEHGNPLEYTFSSTAPWITIEPISIDDPDYPRYDVTVTADDGTLEPGVHETWIEVQSATCYECERIIFTVPETDPPAADEETWGSLKTRFR